MCVWVCLPAVSSVICITDIFVFIFKVLTCSDEIFTTINIYNNGQYLHNATNLMAASVSGSGFRVLSEQDPLKDFSSSSTPLPPSSARVCEAAGSMVLHTTGDSERARGAKLSSMICFALSQIWLWISGVRVGKSKVKTSGPLGVMSSLSRLL